ncbi:MAG: PAS domain S-box protein, partial [Myxococcales bacterium]|nr:PAS domain S-box protein [Myxococcales bacterium]
MNDEDELAARLDLLDNAPFAFFSFGPDGEVLKVNSTWLRWLGQTRPEVEGKLRIHDVLTETSQGTFADALVHIRERGRLDEVDLTLRRKDGSCFPVLLSAAVVPDGQAHFAWARAYFVDTTGRDRGAEHTRRLLESAPDATIVINAAGRIEFVNLEAESSFGYTRAELIGQLVEVLVPESAR